MNIRMLYAESCKSNIRYQWASCRHAVTVRMLFRSPLHALVAYVANKLGNIRGPKVPVPVGAKWSDE